MRPIDADELKQYACLVDEICYYGGGSEFLAVSVDNIDDMPTLDVTPKSGINVKELYEQFVAHIDSMTNEELLESASRAAEMTAGCDDDWPDDLIQVVRCKDCMNRASLDCPMFIVTNDPPWDDIIEDRTEDDGFCHKGKPIPSEY